MGTIKPSSKIYKKTRQESNLRQIEENGNFLLSQKFNSRESCAGWWSKGEESQEEILHENTWEIFLFRKKHGTPATMLGELGNHFEKWK